MKAIGGGVLKNIRHRHFWLALLTLAIIIGGIWSWHRFKIQQAVRLEQLQNLQFQADRRAQKNIR